MGTEEVENTKNLRRISVLDYTKDVGTLVTLTLPTLYNRR